MRPHLKALTGTLLDSGAAEGGIHFRFGTCGNPVTRGSVREKAIGWDQLRSCATTRMTLAMIDEHRLIGPFRNGLLDLWYPSIITDF